MKVLVTQSNSFLGKNLVENLKNLRDGKNRTRPNISIAEICVDNGENADYVFFLPGNNDFTILEKNRDAKVFYISSLCGNEEEETFINRKNCFVFRYPTITGKWQSEDCEIAKICKAVANDNEVVLDNPKKSVELLFVDDFINEMLNAIEGKVNRCSFPSIGEISIDPTSPYDGVTPLEDEDGLYCYSKNTFKTTIGNVLDHIIGFNSMNQNKIIPAMASNSLAQKLFSMYLSYLPDRKMSYSLDMNVDNRGIFTELFKTKNNGQVSINIARPNTTRGQHWHNSKWEVFVVVSGHGLIQERKIGSDIVHSFEVRGEDMRAIIMLPGYTHSITNLEDDRDLVTVMFANEEFDSSHPDTYFEQV